MQNIVQLQPSDLWTHCLQRSLPRGDGLPGECLQLAGKRPVRVVAGNHDTDLHGDLDEATMDNIVRKGIAGICML
jgi:hypothetical protein